MAFTIPSPLQQGHQFIVAALQRRHKVAERTGPNGMATCGTQIAHHARAEEALMVPAAVRVKHPLQFFWGPCSDQRGAA